MPRRRSAPTGASGFLSTNSLAKVIRSWCRGIIGSDHTVLCSTAVRTRTYGHLLLPAADSAWRIFAVICDVRRASSLRWRAGLIYIKIDPNRRQLILVAAQFVIPVHHRRRKGHALYGLLHLGSFFRSRNVGFQDRQDPGKGGFCRFELLLRGRLGRRHLTRQVQKLADRSLQILLPIRPKFREILGVEPLNRFWRQPDCRPRDHLLQLLRIKRRTVGLDAWVGKKTPCNSATIQELLL